MRKLIILTENIFNANICQNLTKFLTKIVVIRYVNNQEKNIHFINQVPPLQKKDSVVFNICKSSFILLFNENKSLF